MRLRNLPILVRALLLHLDGLVQLAVRGAKVVVSLHGWLGRSVTEATWRKVNESVLRARRPTTDERVRRFARSTSVWSARLSHGVISTVVLADRGGCFPQSSQSQSGSASERRSRRPNQILVRFDESERRKEVRHVTPEVKNYLILFFMFKNFILAY